MFSFSSSLIKVPVNFNGGGTTSQFASHFAEKFALTTCVQHRVSREVTTYAFLVIKWWRFNSLINVTVFFRRHFGPLSSRPLLKWHAKGGHRHSTRKTFADPQLLARELKQPLRWLQRKHHLKSILLTQKKLEAFSRFFLGLSSSRFLGIRQSRPHKNWYTQFRSKHR